MRIDKICKTCGFDSNGVCGMYTTCKEGEECDDWEASLEYYTEITKKAPWYIKKPYDQCKISYEKFLDLLQQDEQGVGVEINIYDAIEKVKKSRQDRSGKDKRRPKSDNHKDHKKEDRKSVV